MGAFDMLSDDDERVIRHEGKRNFMCDKCKYGVIKEAIENATGNSKWLEETENPNDPVVFDDALLSICNHIGLHETVITVGRVVSVADVLRYYRNLSKVK